MTTGSRPTASRCCWTFPDTRRTAYRGPDALEIAELFAPEVVLLDIGLPRGMDSRSHRRLRRTARTRTEMTLVAVTGYGDEESLRTASEAGFEHHLVKPLDFDASGAGGTVGDGSQPQAQ